MSAQLQTRPLFDVSMERDIQNIFWVDKYISGTIGVDAVFESKRINEEDLPNFANYNTTAQSNVSHDLNGYDLQFINGKGFRYAQAVAPTIGEAEFEHLGFGTSASDVLWSLKNGLGVQKVKINGQGQFNSGSAPLSNTQHIVKVTDDFFFIHRILDQDNVILFDVARTYVKIGTVMGVNTDAQAGRVLTTDGRIKNLNVDVFSDNASAIVGGLVAGDNYRTPTGVKMIVY